MGMQLFGGGGTLAGLMLGAIAAFIIDRKFDRAGALCAGGGGAGVLRLHQWHVAGFANSAPVALGYLLIAGICYGLTFEAKRSAILPIEDEALVAEGD